MDYNLVLIAIVFVGALALILNYFKNRGVDKIVEQNKNVPQLFLQKTVDNKLRTIQHALRQTITDDPTNDPLIAKVNAQRIALGRELAELKEGFEEQKFSLKAYDQKLANLLKKLNENVIY